MVMLADDSFVLQFWVVTEVDDDTEAVPSRHQIVVNFGTIFLPLLFASIAKP